MSRHRFIPRSYYDTPTAPFVNAEEAWFWFIRCQKARADGARFEANVANKVRPCDPDDLYRAVKLLERQRRLGPEHLRTLDTFGLCERPPWGPYTCVEAIKRVLGIRAPRVLMPWNLYNFLKK